MISGIDYGKGNDESCTVTFVSPEYIERLEKENQQLKSVIKEIREYINNTYDIPIAKGFPFPDKSVIDKKAKKDILQILDKGEQ